jgi:hypothetical protein
VKQKGGKIEVERMKCRKIEVERLGKVKEMTGCSKSVGRKKELSEFKIEW